jgi:hypothetical protein
MTKRERLAIERLAFRLGWEAAISWINLNQPLVQYEKRNLKIGFKSRIKQHIRNLKI